MQKFRVDFWANNYLQTFQSLLLWNWILNVIIPDNIRIQLKNKCHHSNNNQNGVGIRSVLTSKKKKKSQNVNLILDIDSRIADSKSGICNWVLRWKSVAKCLEPGLKL